MKTEKESFFLGVLDLAAEKTFFCDTD